MGAPADGMHGEAPLRAFMARQPSLRFQTGSIGKTINPDVSVHFTACLTPCVGDGDGPVEREVGIKFHARPLCEVVRYELEHGDVVPVPKDYFECTSSD